MLTAGNKYKRLSVFSKLSRYIYLSTIVTMDTQPARKLNDMYQSTFHIH